MWPVYISLRRWYHKQFKDPFTVACDLGPYWHLFNQSEQLFPAKGLREAKRTARRWVREHRWGQARVLKGVVDYDNRKMAERFGGHHDRKGAMSEYTIGIDGLTEDEIIELAPTRIDARSLRRVSSGTLLRLRNICLVEQRYYQDAGHAARVSDRLDRIEREMANRGLRGWLDTPCERCGMRLRLELRGDELIGYCQCTDQVNNAWGSR